MSRCCTESWWTILAGFWRSFRNGLENDEPRPESGIPDPARGIIRSSAAPNSVQAVAWGTYIADGPRPASSGLSVWSVIEYRFLPHATGGFPVADVFEYVEVADGREAKRDSL
jgi:hypothetical protein